MLIIIFSRKWNQTKFALYKVWCYLKNALKIVPRLSSYLKKIFKKFQGITHDIVKLVYVCVCETEIFS